MEYRVDCPHCHAVLKSSKPLRPGKAIRCLKCQAQFTVRQVDQDTLVSAPFQPPPRQTSRIAWLALGGLLLLVVAGAGAAVYWFHLRDSDAGLAKNKDGVANDPETKGNDDDDGKISKLVKLAPAQENEKPKPGVIKEPAAAKAAPPPKPKLPKWVKEAVDNGVKFLKNHPKEKWSQEELQSMGNYPSGFVALTGLTLLECGVPATDPLIVETRKLVLGGPAGGLAKTYDVGLAILFLDRLGRKEDEKLIQSLAVRLVARQNPDGGWPYDCAPLAAADEKLLLAFLQQNRLQLQDLVRPEEFRLAMPIEKEAAVKAKPKPKPKAAPPVRADQLPPELRNLPAVQQAKATPAEPNGAGNRSDNSNSQFAMLGLWIAQKHGVPMERTFNLVDQRFRQSQQPDGTWAYTPDQNPVPQAMTCAGLLGLAIGHGSAQQVALAGQKAPTSAKDVPSLKDALIQNGLAYLGRNIGEPLPNPNTYFLWSLERVAVLYHLDTIGGKDWYSWGAKTLVATQREDGSWFFNNIYTAQSPSVDTCFALLFLIKANFVPTLSDNLRDYIRVSDPNEK